MLWGLCQWLYELQKKAGLIKNKKTPESSRALVAKVTRLKAKTHNSINEGLYPDENLKTNNRNNPALDRKVKRTRQNHTDTWQSMPSKEDSQPSVPRISCVKPLITFFVMVSHALAASSKPKVELD